MQRADRRPGRAAVTGQQLIRRLATQLIAGRGIIYIVMPL